MELLLVIVILGVLSAVLVPRFGVALEGGRTAVAARTVAQLGRYARTMALLNQMPVDFVLNLGSGTVSVEAGSLSGAAAVSDAAASDGEEETGDAGASPNAETEIESLIESSGGTEGGARFGFALSQDDKDKAESGSWFRGGAKDGDEEETSADDLFDENEGGLAEEISTEQKLSSVVLAFPGYTDTADNVGGTEEGIVRIRYRTNGTCRPYEVRVTGERAGDVMTVAVDTVGTPVVMTGDGKVYGKDGR